MARQLLNARILKARISREALVRACYRSILGREPEAGVVADHELSTTGTDLEAEFAGILDEFLSSPEFRSRPIASQSLLGVFDLVDKPRSVVEDEVRSRCTVAYLGRQVALCRVLGRYMMFVETTDVGFATHIMMRGVWEMWLTEFMVRTVKPGMRVLDIGANFGYYSLLMSDLVQHTGKLFAFEPNANIAELARRSLSVNGFADRSEVLEVALSNASAPAQSFYIPHGEPKNARFESDASEELRAHGRFVEVPVTSIDELADRLGRVDFVKIDTEGAEGGILGGMVNLIRNQKPKLVVELNVGRGYDAGAILNDLIDVYGEISHLADDGHIYPVSIDRLMQERVGHDWLIYAE